ncbi:hypothetical protein GCM10007416_16880 [Kroppenstedtia guangzhouensis]|jgi:hypothetical protein|uniref:DUF4025 domain-containing protein n=1 Tax=Kroppenstedtia guangzhouensis TaxID=1274356 RepID=A0ABQ1GJA7_9BACL|nr:hypothetical protein [Kroppenstedtia guangzhouensis]GGA44355.1 hypothetical protein GCM10007416_16880 [Kroppenstedtia guangzhouensis]
MIQHDQRESTDDPSPVSKTKQTVVPEAQEKDLDFEGKDEAWLDVDRMINEGLGSGHVGDWTGKIEESRPLKDEEPTRESDDGA